MVGAARSGKKAEVRVKAELTATVPALKSILTCSVLRLSMELVTPLARAITVFSDCTHGEV